MRRLTGLTVATVWLAAWPAAAQGPFMSLDVGMAVATGLTGADVVAIGGDGAQQFHDLGHDPRRGFRAGGAGGYAWGRVRAEGEYFNRTAPETGPAHATFASVLYELHDRGVWRPYAGVGGGVQWVGGGEMAAYAYADDAAALATAAAGESDLGYIPEPTGVPASPRSALGFQLVGGLERVLRESVRLGTRLRWARFEQVMPESQFWSASVTLRYEF